MFNKSLIGLCLVLSLAACATSTAPSAKPTVAASATTPVGCVGSTATRLPVNPNDCAGFGSSYTKQSLDQTGQPYAGDALRMLDPSLSVHGGP
jgi:hypothetical protein